ncbi:hypothetical protein B7P43_G01919, partial [Cryptotermes secundus]
IEFLCCENEAVGNIHKILKNVYGDDAVERSTVSRWARKLYGESGHANIRDSPRTGSPHTAQTPDNVQNVNDMVLEDRLVTVKETKQDVLVLHDNARPHVSQKTKDEITKRGWTTLPHSPHSTGVAPSDYRLFPSRNNI